MWARVTSQDKHRNDQDYDNDDMIMAIKIKKKINKNNKQKIYIYICIHIINNNINKQRRYLFPNLPYETSFINEEKFVSSFIRTNTYTYVCTL